MYRFKRQHDSSDAILVEVSVRSSRELSDDLYYKKKHFLGWKYPKISLFDFDNKITAQQRQCFCFHIQIK